MHVINIAIPTPTAQLSQEEGGTTFGSQKRSRGTGFGYDQFLHDSASNQLYSTLLDTGFNQRLIY